MSYDVYRVIPPDEQAGALHAEYEEWTEKIDGPYETYGEAAEVLKALAGTLAEEPEDPARRVTHWMALPGGQWYMIVRDGT